MGRHKISDEPRNWPLGVKITKSVSKYLDSLASRLGWSKASFLSELILRFGEALIKEVTKERDLTDNVEGEDPARVKPPVSKQEKDL